jgi:Ca2+-binding EF-hand superfamily protein
MTRSKITMLAFSTALVGGMATSAFAQGAGSGMPSGGAGMGGGGRGGHGMTMFELYDTNGDGKITKEEFESVREKRFETLDVNKDGKVTFEEFVEVLKPRNPDRLKKVFARMDKNGDGALSKEEWEDAGLVEFERFDINKDGVITREEFAEVMAKNRAGKAGRPPMRPGEQPPAGGGAPMGQPAQ